MVLVDTGADGREGGDFSLSVGWFFGLLASNGDALRSVVSEARVEVGFDTEEQTSKRGQTSGVLKAATKTTMRYKWEQERWLI